MAAISGTAGSVVVNGTAVAQVSEWSLNLAAATNEVSVMGADWRTKVPGLADGSGSFQLFHDQTEPAMHTTVRNALINRTSGSARFYFGTAANYYTVATFYVTGIGAATSVDGVGTESFDFESSGAITYT